MWIYIEINLLLVFIRGLVIYDVGLNIFILDELIEKLVFINFIVIFYVYWNSIVAEATAAEEEFQSAAIFSAIKNALEADGPALVKKVDEYNFAFYLFTVLIDLLHLSDRHIFMLKRIFTK